MGIKDLFQTKNPADARITFSAQLEPIAARTVGTGSSSTIKHEWLTNQHRDSLATYLGHAHMTQYCALVEGKSSARMVDELIDTMVEPCGPPPKEAEADTDADM